MPAPAIEIRGCGNSFGIFHNGRQVGKANSYDNACIRARTATNRLQQVDRACMCCRQTFTAEGHFNRLCTNCKEAYA